MKVGLISIQVELDGLHLGQVAMLRVLVCVTVRPGTDEEQLERWLLIPDHTERYWHEATPRSVRPIIGVRCPKSWRWIKLGVRPWRRTVVSGTFCMARPLSERWIKYEMVDAFQFTCISLRSPDSNFFRCWFPVFTTTSHQVTQTINSCRRACQSFCTIIGKKTEDLFLLHN